MADSVQMAESRWLEFLDASQKDSPEAARQWVTTKGKTRRKRPKSYPYGRKDGEDKLVVTFRLWLQDGADVCPLESDDDAPEVCRLCHNPHCCVFCVFIQMKSA